MTGLLFKELRQHRLILLAAVLIPVFVVFFPLLSLAAASNSYAHPFMEAMNQLSGTEGLTAGGMLTRFFMTLVGMILLAVLTSTIFSADESKKWAYFTASHPKGYRGHLYMKYTVLFMVFGLYFVSLYYMDSLLQMLVFHVTGKDMLPFSEVYMLLFFLQLVLNAWNIPFMIRFGVKNSAFARVIAILVLAFLVLVYLLFGPLPGGMNGYINFMFGFVEKLMKGELTGIISVIISAFPLAAVGLYLLSYRISCKLFMKGAADYVK